MLENKPDQKRILPYPRSVQIPRQASKKQILASNPYDNLGETLPFILIGPDSPLSYRKAARRLAENFANSTHFSPAPYEAQEGEDYGPKYARDRVLLFAEATAPRRLRYFGAVGIRWKEFDDLPERGWFMTWAWFQRADQRKGHLTKAWPHILKLFPNLMPLPPLTAAMESFLKKVQYYDPIFSRMRSA